MELSNPSQPRPTAGNRAACSLVRWRFLGVVRSICTMAENDTSSPYIPTLVENVLITRPTGTRQKGHHVPSLLTERVHSVTLPQTNSTATPKRHTFPRTTPHPPNLDSPVPSPSDTTITTLLLCFIIGTLRDIELWSPTVVTASWVSPNTPHRQDWAKRLLGIVSGLSLIFPSCPNMLPSVYTPLPCLLPLVRSIFCTLIGNQD